MKNELKIFFTALMFYSRIPVPKSTGYSAKNLNKATRYFPFVGAIVGGIGALVFMGTSYFFSSYLAIIASLASMILLTGAFHEDALADFCDGFGGGYGKEKILRIMKDSQIGTYGAVGLIFLFLSKVVLLAEFEASHIPVVLISAHILSRLNPVLMIFTSEYVSEDRNSKSKPIGEKHSGWTLVIATLIGLSPLVLIQPMLIPVILVLLALILIYFRYYVHKKVGGYTGDILGALQQFSELGFYIAYLIAIQLI